jgi:hypothetical protein
MAVAFSPLFDLVRVLTGNDDLDLGAEVLPDARVDVLLKTAVLTLPTYSSNFPVLSWNVDPTNGTQFFLASDVSAVVPDEVVQAVLHVAAHKYFVGLGRAQKDNADRTEAFIYKCSENLTGQSVEVPS